MSNVERKKVQELFELARTLSSTLDIDALLKRIGEVAEQLTSSEASSIMLVDEDREHLFFKVAIGEKSNVLKKMRVKIGEGIAGTVAQTRKPLIVNDVSKDSRFAGVFDKSSGFVTKSILAVPLVAEDELIGVAEVLNKTHGEGFNEEDSLILQSLATFASVSIVNARLAEDQKNFFVYIIEIIVQAIESREPKITGHTYRVAQLSTSIARFLELDSSKYKDVYYGALLHDIGYLSKSKIVALEAHPKIGWEMVSKINILRGAAELVLAHHELYDGSGFPQGLKGEQIPLGARIIALAEFIDDMKLEGHSQETVYQMVKANEGAKFDPKITKIYLNEIARLQQEVPA